MKKMVAEFIEEYHLDCGEKIRYMDLVSEVGELGKEIIKGCNYGKQEYTNTPNIESELGDCLFSLLALCHEMGIDADNALNTALTKYKKRFNSKGEIGSGE